MEHTTVFGKQVGALVFEEIALHLRDFFEKYITDEGQNYEVSNVSFVLIADFILLG